ncbi:MarR family winged helix-turn-helix transcriptional regulator [Secundilactobacillus hailunensis]|uniref:MarR family winged helix-turn-helix transcriptional regulator n=1 Tax=Secundilactobacillus hailunensis TaxID=2559923 RepID=A0ABW1T6I0_9LACO|nr:MarR family transcriptional regulator [Secundilactobacillus hailunensis]
MESYDSSSIADRLHSLVSLEIELVNVRLKEIELNSQQARLIKFIGENPNTIQKTVAQFLNRQNATITNMLKSLEKRGYITRTIPDTNERQKQLNLTAKGNETLVDINRVFNELESTIKLAVPEDQRTGLVTNLNHIKLALDLQH